MKNSKIIYFKIAFLLAVLLFNGCDPALWVGNDECYATDGTNSDSIEITWGEMIITEDNNEISPVSYSIEGRKEGDPSFSLLQDGLTTTQYTDSTVIPGVTYYYQVTALYPDDTTDTTIPDSGFAMNASILSIGSAAQQYFSQGTAGPVETQYKWYKIMAQGGWQYTVKTYSAGNPSADTVITLYGNDDIIDDITTNDDYSAPFSQITHTFTASGIYYIKVEVLLSSKDFNISMWHH